MASLPQILYIDDEFDLLDLAQSFCREEGLQVDVTDCALKGLELFKNNHYKIIISDARMPQMSGYDLLLTLKKDFNFQGHFILVTGDDGLLDKSQLQHYDLVLQKPLSFVKLIDGLKEMLLNPKK